MSNLPQISGKELEKAFKRDGWFTISIRGSHLKMRKSLQPVGQKTIIIPLHKILKKGTLTGILKDSNTSIEKLKELL